mmetsp:Transcript_4169/g.10418  ORF Transcript_4169/g.10418 Transcript_4169/m.10418 type:complete len:327 (-) Transcript_4169:950-1930(-)
MGCMGMGIPPCGPPAPGPCCSLPGIWGWGCWGGMPIMWGLLPGWCCPSMPGRPALLAAWCMAAACSCIAWRLAWSLPGPAWCMPGWPGIPGRTWCAAKAGFCITGIGPMGPAGLGANACAGMAPGTRPGPAGTATGMGMGAGTGAAGAGAGTVVAAGAAEGVNVGTKALAFALRLKGLANGLRPPFLDSPPSALLTAALLSDPASADVPAAAPSPAGLADAAAALRSCMRLACSSCSFCWLLFFLNSSNSDSTSGLNSLLGAATDSRLSDMSVAPSLTSGELMGDLGVPYGDAPRMSAAFLMGMAPDASWDRTLFVSRRRASMSPD